MYTMTDRAELVDGRPAVHVSIKFRDGSVRERQVESMLKAIRGADADAELGVKFRDCAGPARSRRNDGRESRAEERRDVSEGSELERDACAGAPCPPEPPRERPLRPSYNRITNYKQGLMTRSFMTKPFVTEEEARDGADADRAVPDRGRSAARLKPVGPSESLPACGIGLLDNGKEFSDVVLDALGGTLRRDTASPTSVSGAKGFPARRALLDRWRRRPTSLQRFGHCGSSSPWERDRRRESGEGRRSTVALISRSFCPLGQIVARGHGHDGLAIVMLPHPIARRTSEDRRKGIAAAPNACGCSRARPTRFAGNTRRRSFLCPSMPSPGVMRASSLRTSEDCDAGPPRPQGRP